MANYLTGVFSRALNQLLLLFGGIFLLAFLLCHVAGEIRGAGESLLGRGYYYLVAPGVVCHEAGHALGCLMTGTKIEQIEPFHPRGNTLGYVVYRYSRDASLISNLRHLIIGTGPVWFGCLMIWICSKFGRTVFSPKFSDAFPFEHYPKSRRYWWVVLKISGRMVWNTIRVWRWKSTLNVVYLYFVFCIVSEMALSWEDIEGAWKGFVVLIALLVALNVIPWIGRRVGLLTWNAAPFLFRIHVVMAFVLLGDLVFVLLFVMPLRFIL
ncbi:MAG: hypothetical protein MJ240_03160 [Kiritimatiellae bacterium]|nr:hypothetical protein [Kiritimatiellia bacterium]